MIKRALITGVTGQDGAYLARFLIKNGYKVFGVSRKLTPDNTIGLSFLGILEEIDLFEVDLLDLNKVIGLFEKIQPQEVYNLSAQSSVDYSFQTPALTFSYNTASVQNLLECIRLVNNDIRYYQASSSEMFGNVSLKNLPISESLLFHPVSPYGISKASAHWLTVNHREAYGIFSCCGILFNHESALRGDQFVIKKIIRSALEIKSGKRDFLTLGNLAIQRDWGYAPKYVEAMWLMMQKEEPKDYIICSGYYASLQEVVLRVFEKLDLNMIRHLRLDNSFIRSLDLNVIYGDNSMAKRDLQWNYDINVDQLVNYLIKDIADYMSWLENNKTLKDS